MSVFISHLAKLLATAAPGDFITPFQSVLLASQDYHDHWLRKSLFLTFTPSNSYLISFCWDCISFCLEFMVLLGSSHCPLNNQLKDPDKKGFPRTTMPLPGPKVTSKPSLVLYSSGHFRFIFAIICSSQSCLSSPSFYYEKFQTLRNVQRTVTKYPSICN